jgi:hypothetical protein
VRHQSFFAHHHYSLYDMMCLLIYFYRHTGPTTASQLINVDRQGVGLFYKEIRTLMQDFNQKDDPISFSRWKTGVDEKQAEDILDNKPLSEMDDDTEKLRNILEIDEGVMAHVRKYHQGRPVRIPHWIFGILEPDTGKIYLELVPTRERKVLEPIIRSKVQDGCIIFSDGWRSYDHLEECGYYHHTVNQSFVW